MAISLDVPILEKRDYTFWNCQTHSLVLYVSHSDRINNGEVETKIEINVCIFQINLAFYFFLSALRFQRYLKSICYTKMVQLSF